MECFLFQLPPSFQYTLLRLENILAQMEPARRNVVEFRHTSWWNPKVYAAFRKAGVIFCSSSALKLPDELIMTIDEVYIRFHGLNKMYRHDYSSDEIAMCAGTRKSFTSGYIFRRIGVPPAKTTGLLTGKTRRLHQG